MQNPDEAIERFQLAKTQGSNHYAMCKYDDATGTYIPLEVRPYIDDFQAGAASRDAEIAELVAAIESAINWANGREDEWGDRAVDSFSFLYDALAKVRKP